jgi:hypothetical protein
MTRVVVAHMSGVRTAESDWRHALAELEAEGADVITVTEAQSPAARNALERFAKTRGWILAHHHGKPGMGECAILARADTFALRYSTAIRLTDLTLRTNRQAPLYAVVMKLVHRATGETLWFSTAHLPAHLEGSRNFRPVWASKVHRSAVAGWKAGLIDLGIDRNLTLTMDSNVNIKRAWVRLWARRSFPSLRSAWRHPFPGTGTFKARVIDLCLTSLPVVKRARLVDGQPLPGRRAMPYPGFDHVALLTVLDVPLPKENR